ncbi:MAG: hypothetical protein R3A10_11210 [Caldilineaceae bacterium]
MPQASDGLISIGSNHEAILEARIVSRPGSETGYMRLLALRFPRAVTEPIDAHEVVHVVESNFDANWRPSCAPNCPSVPPRFTPPPSAMACRSLGVGLPRPF